MSTTSVIFRTPVWRSIWLRHVLAGRRFELADARLARIDRLKTEIIDLHARLATRDREISELKQFRDTALSRLAAQHEEITALRTQLRAADHAKIRSLPNR